MHRDSIYKNYIPSTIAPQETNIDAYWFIFHSDKLLITIHDNKVNIPFMKHLEDFKLSVVRKQYLGTLFGQPCYSVEVDSDITELECTSFRGLRSLYGSLDEDIFFLAGRALHIVNWDKTNQYCSSCGSKTLSLENELAKKCSSCGFTSYPVISPAMITAIFKDNKILLAHNKHFNGNMHSIIAGFVEPGETLEECVKREAMEEVGINIKNIKYFGSQPWPFPNSLMIGFTADYESGEITVDGDEITSAGWFDMNNLPELPSQMSIARKIIDWYIENYKA